MSSVLLPRLLMISDSSTTPFLMSLMPCIATGPTACPCPKPCSDRFSKFDRLMGRWSIFRVVAFTSSIDDAIALKTGTGLKTLRNGLDGRDHLLNGRCSLMCGLAEDVRILINLFDG